MSKIGSNVEEFLKIKTIINGSNKNKTNKDAK